MRASLRLGARVYGGARRNADGAWLWEFVVCEVAAG